MSFIYHGVPDPMIGSKLMSLNEIQDNMPKIYKQHLGKYKGRKEIMERQIPLLNCLWNDVVQFLPLHPQKVFELQKKLGLITEIPPYKFFELDIDSLNPEKAVVFFKTAPGEENIQTKWLKDVDLSLIQEIPEATVEYYKTMIGTGDLPFNYQFIPHIIYKGDVDISNAKIVTLTT